MKFDNVLLLSDFDGTLNDDSGHTPQSVLDAVTYFENNGGRFSVSTGRTYQGLCRYPYTSRFNAPALLSNGAMAYDFRKREIAFLDGIGDEGVEMLRVLMTQFPDVAIEMYPFDETFAVHLSEGSHRHFTNQGIPYTVVDDPAEAVRPWAKEMLCCPEGKSLAVQDFLRQSSAVGFLPTTGTFVEVLRRGVDKGSGLLKLADMLCIPHSRVYAVGDGYNDVDMLHAAAGAFVPCNGAEEALAAADYVVRSNNDGTVAHAIEILDRIY